MTFLPFTFMISSPPFYISSSFSLLSSKSQPPKPWNRIRVYTETRYMRASSLALSISLDCDLMFVILFRSSLKFLCFDSIMSVAIALRILKILSCFDW